MKLYQAMPRMLERLGVEQVFGLLGGTNVNWVAEGVDAGIFKFTWTRHEESAVHAATGYARASGQLGVATVARGPGFANAINGLVAATKSHVPILLIVGESPPPFSMTSYTEQNVPQQAITELIGAGFHHIGRPEDLEDAFMSAAQQAWQLGRPQVIVADTGTVGDAEFQPSGPEFNLGAGVMPPKEDVHSVVDLIAASSRPLILAGQGAVLADARTELIELSERIGARLATTLRANRLFSGHPQDLGICGTWASPAVRDILSETDLVLSFGSSLNPNTTDKGHVFNGAKVIPCEIDADHTPRISPIVELLVGDARQSALALLEEWKRRTYPDRDVVGVSAPTFQQRSQSVAKVDIGSDPKRGLDSRRVAAAIDHLLPQDRVVVTDSGRTVAMTVAMVNAQDARSWLNGNSYGCVGLGLGTALGAVVAHPGRRVALFTGDGGFMMGLGTLDTIRAFDMDLTVVIYNDQQAGSELKELREFNQPSKHVHMELPDVRRLADAFGGVGIVLRTESDLEQLELPTRGLTIIDARIDPMVDGRSALG